MINKDQAEILNNTLSRVPGDIMNRLVSQNKCSKCVEYPNELRSFALTLKFDSRKAFQYVREKFNLALPHPNTIRTWYNLSDGEPSFTRDAFVAMKLNAESAGLEHKELVCVLMLNEMAINDEVIGCKAFTR